VDLLNSAIFLVVLLGSSFGLSYWAHRARTDRSAFVGLYLVFGFPAVLLFLLGIVLSVNGREAGPYLILIGLGLGLPLAKAFRKLLARFMPVDPASAVDLAGLCLLFGVAGLFITLFAVSPDDINDSDSATNSVGYASLVIQAVAFVGVAYAAVGLGVHRNWRQATARLGLVWPTWRTPFVAVGFMVLGLIVSAAAGLLTEALQPDLSRQIDEVTEGITADIRSPIGAVVLGLCAGIGEELLLRGALQPRFGLILTSAVFALLHTQYGVSYVIVGLFGMGLLLGWERNRFGTTAAILTHALFNTLVVLAQIYA